jgi:hypothetical protein
MAAEKDECIELKNIKYKTMLLSGKMTAETKSSSDLTNLEKFLEDDKNSNQSEPWCKLDKTMKIKKAMFFADSYSSKNELSKDEDSALRVFLRDCLDRKKLQRVKDVEYDKLTGEIKDIPALVFNKTTTHFTLKNLDKQRVSTLKSLPPKRATKGTIKNTKPTDNSDSDNDNQ